MPPPKIWLLSSQPELSLGVFKQRRQAAAGRCSSLLLIMAEDAQCQVTDEL